MFTILTTNTENLVKEVILKLSSLIFKVSRLSDHQSLYVGGMLCAFLHGRFET